MREETGRTRRTSSAATVSARMRDSAKAISSANEGAQRRSCVREKEEGEKRTNRSIEMMADHEHLHMYSYRLASVATERRGKQLTSRCSSSVLAQ